MKKRRVLSAVVLLAAAVGMFVSLTGCPLGGDGGVLGGDTGSSMTGGNVPASMVGTWYSDYSLTRVTITEDAEFSYTYDGDNMFKGGLDVDEETSTIHFAENYEWLDGEWDYWDDCDHVRVNYVLASSGYLFTDAFEVSMEVYKRTAGSSGLVGTWEYEWKKWYDYSCSEEDPVIHRKTVLTLNSDGTYIRKKYSKGVEVDSETGNYTHGDINPGELYLSGSADYDKAWVIDDDYLVLGPRYWEQQEIALIKE
jgi:hypothetical protein